MNLIEKHTGVQGDFPCVPPRLAVVSCFDFLIIVITLERAIPRNEAKGYAS